MRPWALVFDVETSVDNHEVGKFRASPFHPDNNIVLSGFKSVALDSFTYGPTVVKRSPETTADFIMRRVTEGVGLTMLVGHNVKFDIMYLYKYDYEQFERVVRGLRLWDTMLAEYLLSGQRQMYPSLDYCSTRRGGVVKDDKIKEYWDAGVRTEDIPIDELTSYLMGDVDNTSKVFISQLKEAKEKGMLQFILTQMEALKAVIEMEWNGMHIDLPSIEQEEKRLATEIKVQHMMLQDQAASLMSGTRGAAFVFKDHYNPSSTDHVAKLIFGGDIKIQKKRIKKNAHGEMLSYKTGPKKGTMRYENYEEVVHFDGFEDARKLAALYNLFTAGGKHSTDNEALEKISANVRSNFANKQLQVFITILLKYRSLVKEQGTYIEGYTKLVWPTDSCLHPNLNMTATHTGRLSCSQPNLQNISKKEVD